MEAAAYQVDLGHVGVYGVECVPPSSGHEVACPGQVPARLVDGQLVRLMEVEADAAEHRGTAADVMYREADARVGNLNRDREEKWEATQ